ncbi:glycoside hydrolase family 6 protein [Arthrobacter sp. NPDC092385]|uniref:glycoside hydrolase family 6 protein n=1 Tax=Arthrobacter sp. NPDC092385 TaxID=3363943 RepID=UPI0038245861
MPLRLTKIVALAVVGVVLGASGATAATDFIAPCTTTDAACLAQRLTAVEAWIEANDTDASAPGPSASPGPSPTTATASWLGSIRYTSAADGKATPLTVAITSPSGTHANKVVYVEAWQNNAKKADVFAEGRDLTGTTAQNLSLPALPAGVYELRLMVFDGPPAGSYTWGTMRFNSVGQNLTVAASAAPAFTTTRVLYDGPGQVDQFAGYDILKTTPTARWYAGGTPAEAQADIRQRVTAANGKVVGLLVYNAPIRDVGSYSAGGAANLAAYRAWIDGVAAGIGTAPVIVSVEPDALGHLNELTAAQQAERVESIKYAVQKLKANPNAKVYVDASNWVDAAEMADRIKRSIPAGVAIDGISVNVSAYNSNASIIDYGNKVISASGLPWKMIVDTSRNGVATASTWCNPAGQGLGKLPTLTPGVPNVDAFLWLKAPGESDGTCNGGPGAGAFFPERAQELIKNARL